MNRKLICWIPLVLVLSLVGVSNGAGGLLGQYYEWSGAPPTASWGTPVLERIDSTVNFNWTDTAPDPAVPADNFAVRWTGEIIIPTSGTYTFRTQTDDGVRLWVNDELLIDNWTDGNSGDSGNIELAGGQRYPIKLEYYENTGDARCELSWLGPGILPSPIPSQYLWVGGDMHTPYFPNPADGAILRDTWVTLNWMPGDYAASHSIYVGENRDDVEAGTGDTFRANQTDTSFALGFPGFPYPDGLVLGTTYYWRIEDVETDGVTTHTSPVWSFSIASKSAYSPNPSDGTGFVDPNVVLSWQPGIGAILHTVYFGEDCDAVSNAVGGIPQGALTYQPGTLGLGKVFYWRVDEFLGVETVKGEIWCFTTPGTVGNERPANGAVNVKDYQVLMWSPADNAASHQVYLGTDKDVVRNAGTGSPEYKGSKNLGSESSDPGLLQKSTTYYWRIDAVDSSGSALKGPVWTFTTADFLVVEDFEDYTDNDAAGEAIWQAWIDGFGVATNGSQVGYLMPPYAEQTTVHGGGQSMPLLYDNAPGAAAYSEAMLNLSYPVNWTQGGVETLTLWFHGSIVNGAAPVYVALNGNAVVTHDDPSATQIHEWTKWNIPLQAFADLGVSLTNVSSLTVGVGNRTGAPAVSTGSIYIDDIGLH
jgi:hypothetical protein